MSGVRDNGMTILVTGIVRDVASTIHQDVDLIEGALRDFHSVKWFLVESDSEDNTVDQLDSLSLERDDFSYTSLGKIQNSVESRTVGMAKARNRYLKELKENPKYQVIDIIAVADFNGLNSKLTRDSVASCFAVENWDACFANQSGRYYDIWALRHPLWSPSDCWKQLEFLKRYSRFPEAALYVAVNSKMIRIPQTDTWIEVESAFGGLALYDSEVFKFANYSGLDESGNETCEHVHFNRIIGRNGGAIYINPRLVNTTKTDHSSRSSFIQSLYQN
jgi:hypothetical protein